MSYTAHIDTFARDNLPPREQWPELRFDLPELQYPARLNCAAELLDEHGARGHGDRIALRSPDGECTYTQLLAQANRIANVLVREMGLKPGNRVLLRGPNNPMMAACWFAVIKAGGICVGDHAAAARQGAHRDRQQGRDHARALRQAPGRGTEAGAAGMPDAAEQSRTGTTTRRTRSIAGAASSRSTFDNVDTAADDVALIAFTSGTTGKPKGTMHFHRDVIAMCDCFPRSCLQAGARTTSSAARRRSPSPSAWAACCASRCASAPRTVLVEKLTPETLLEAIQHFKATICFTAPTLYRADGRRCAKNYDLSIAEEMRLGGRGAARRDAPAVQAGDRHRDHRRHRRDRDDPHLHLARARARAARRHRLRDSRLHARRCSTRTASPARRAWSAASR